MTWSWHLERQSRVKSQEAKGGLHAGEVDLGLMMMRVGIKLPVIVFVP